ncbi:MAG TPA: ADP-forming succinate--CoA ligase subunit beta [Anaerovoracaceae bacterium]|nr:ADP-forming succinate--CoA ligase subunit beta [Anaerovoracaceae bacterium]
MNIHEYQSKEVFKSYGIPTLDGYKAESLEEAEEKAELVKTDVSVVKAQIHAGGRGKAGGVILAKSKKEILAAAEKLLGEPLITHQTSKYGQIVKKIYLEEGCNIDKEYYLSLIVNRKKSCFTFIASSEGGMDIETVAKTNGDAIVYVDIDPELGLKNFHINRIANFLDLDKKKLAAILNGIYKCFVEKDVSLLEINPLVLTKEGEIIALDAKMSFDDNALFKHPDILKYKDESEEEKEENEANKHGLAYVKLDGNIGCLVNGAGLAMATMDAIHLAGGSPANFLDVGGSASVEMVSKGFEIILSNINVKGIFINIFGGIMRCDTIAEGIIKAASDLDIKVPIVVRLEGANADIGLEILSNSDINVMLAEDMDDGASKIVSLI